MGRIEKNGDGKNVSTYRQGIYVLFALQKMHAIIRSGAG
jgi:hypothetical protein